MGTVRAATELTVATWNTQGKERPAAPRPGVGRHHQEENARLNDLGLGKAHPDPAHPWCR